jgi:DNA recombination protein RmuC
MVFNYVIIIICAINFLLLVFILFKMGKGPDVGPIQSRLDNFDNKLSNEFSLSRKEQSESQQGTRNEITTLFGNLGTGLFESLKKSQDETALLSKNLSENVKYLNDTVKQRVDDLVNRNDLFRKEMEEKLKEIRLTLENKVAEMQKGNENKLEEMRKTVDEKLQKTLDERLSESFKMVSDRLEQVHKGLGEMQNLAQDVGGLKKVLSNVKTRGMMGEMQLGAILENILAPAQYRRNVKTKPGSTELVEYVICLPGKDEDGKEVLLPVDAKFPIEAYSRLVDAYEAIDPVGIETARKSMETEIKRCAKDISEKYLAPPHTTDFGILFLPTEGLFAEVVRNNALIESLQRDYRVVITGPTTLGAFLNSLNMGFRTLTIEKRSSEVWKILGVVRKEFDTFGGVLEKAQEKIKKAGEDIEKLVGTRTRVIQRTLRGIDTLPAGNDLSLLSQNDEPEDENSENNE